MVMSEFVGQVTNFDIVLAPVGDGGLLPGLCPRPTHSDRA